MRRPLLAVLAAAPLALSACGTQGIDIPKEQDASIRAGATTFYTHCGACHTLKAAGQQGSSSNVRSREYKDGPNFNQRKEELNQVLYAIRNGGFSSGPMPQNIVTGQEAENVAKFVAKYSGSEIARAPTVRQENPQGVPGGESPFDQGSKDQSGGGGQAPETGGGGG